MRALAAIVCLLATPTALGYDPTHLATLRQTGQCFGCDLVGADFNFWNLSGYNLTGSDLSFANFRGATIGNANFSGANLSGAYWPDGRQCRPGSIGFCM